MKIHKLATALLLSALMGACSAYETRPAAPVKMSDGMLTVGRCMTIYTFDKDTAGKSNCNGPCAANWPPLFAMDGDAASGDYSIVTRDDRKKQWAFKGKPLYFWVKDQKAGDKTGDGVNNVWRVAKP